MIPVLGIPVYNRVDLLIRCLKSIDYPVERVILVNNGQIPDLSHIVVRALESELRAAWPIQSAEIDFIEPNCNLGVAGGWNAILDKVVVEWRKDYVVICNNDIQWSKDDLERMHNATISDPEMCAVFGNWSYSNFVITRKGLASLGFFDENFWPGYFEDGDHWRRIVVSQAKICHAVGVQSVHGEAPDWGSHAIKSDPSLAKQNSDTFQKNSEYYRRKWGFVNEQTRETFTYPFNDSRLQLNAWALTEERRREPHYLVMSSENVILRKGASHPENIVL